MKLADLLQELSQIGELAQHEARQQYAAHLQNLHNRLSSLPGNPSLFNVTPLQPFMPANMKMAFTVALSEQGGEVHSSFDASTKRDHVFGKRRHPCLADIEVTWGSTNVPEAVCRVRDTKDSIQDHKLHEVKWDQIKSIQQGDTDG